MVNQVRLLTIINSRIKKLGSFEDYIVHYARKANEIGWALGFVFPGVGAQEIVQRIKDKNATILPADSSWNSKEGSRELIRCIREFKPDIVNFHFCDTANFLRVFMYCRFHGISVVYHYHGEIRPLHTLNWRNSHLSALRLLSFFWNKVITVSNANKTFLRALSIRTPIDVVYNGINVADFLQRSAEMGQISPRVTNVETVNCLYIGSIIDRKRVDILLRAFSIARKKVPAARLTIVGGGALDGPSRKLATELQLDDVVHFTGLLVLYPFELLKSSDILVSASESESFGLVFAEAMSFGLPIVACRVGGIPEVVAHGQTGLLVEANDSKAFADALVILLEDRQLRTRMGQAGLERVKGAFQLADTIDATFQSLARVI